MRKKLNEHSRLQGERNHSREGKAGVSRGLQDPITRQRGVPSEAPRSGEGAERGWQEGRPGGGARRPQTPWGEALRFRQDVNTDFVHFLSCFYVGKNSYKTVATEHG